MTTPIDRVADRYEPPLAYHHYGPANESHAAWLKRYHANVEIARQRRLAPARWFARAA